MSKIYVTRHGRTSWNVQRIISGTRGEIELLEEGRQMARDLGQEILDKGIKIDLVITSQLKRAVDTGAIVAETLGGVPTAVDERLHERDFGTMEGQSYDDEDFLAQNYQLALRMGGGESPMMMAQRLYNCLDELPKQYPGKTLLLVAHGAACRVIHTYFHSLTNEEYAKVRIGNCQLMEYDYHQHA